MKKNCPIKLSLCMIVKNEAHNLKDCLAPLRSVVDEIIVVDTGSEDETKIVAHGLGAKVFNFNWCDDFAAARNASIRQATGDYILWLDADDRMDFDNIEKLRYLKRMLPKKRNQAFYFIIHAKEPEGEKEFLQLRIFPNMKGAFFQGKIHEQIYQSLAHLGIKFVKTDVSVHHIGYENPDIKRKKAERNLKIIEEILKAEPDNLIIHYHAARTLAGLNRKFEAIEHMKRVMEDERTQNGDREFFLTAGILLGKYYEEAHLYEEAIRVFERLKKDFAGIALLHFCLGVAQFLKGNYGQAREELKKSVSLPMEVSLFPLDFKQIQYYQYYTLGQCYLESGEIDSAKEWFLKSIGLYRDEYKSFEALGLISLRDHKYNEAIAYFQRSIEAGGASDKIYSNLGLAFKKVGRSEEAEAALVRAIEINPSRLEALTNLGHLYYENKAYAKARECFQKALDLNNELIDVRIVLSEIYFRQYDVDNLISQCDSLLKHLGLPRNIILETLDDLALLYLKIADTLNEKGLKALSWRAYYVSFLINPTQYSFAKILGIGRSIGEGEKSFMCLKEAINFHKGHGKDISFLDRPSLSQC